ALLALGDAGGDREGLGTDLDAGPGGGEEVVVPVRVGRRARLRGEDGELVAHRLVDDRVDALLAAAGAGGVEQENRGALEGAADATLVGAKLLDDRAVVVAHPPSVPPGAGGRNRGISVIADMSAGCQDRLHAAPPRGDRLLPRSAEPRRVRAARGVRGRDPVAARRR